MITSIMRSTGDDTGTIIAMLVGIAAQQATAKAVVIQLTVPTEKPPFELKVRGKITVPKNGKAREVPLSPELADVLRDLAETRHRREGFADPGWVFLSTKGQQFMERNFNRSFTRLTTAAAKKKVRPLNLHCTRHTFATLALESGRSIKWVAEILGHSDPTITLRTYAHAMHKDDDDLGFLANPRGESADRPRTAPNRPKNLPRSRK
ncbi:MAG: site-specific integrase [Deltaproteobacteria bacterium]|nr:site-specific integrase [Deltaproteobacteria bacterium]